MAGISPLSPRTVEFLARPPVAGETHIWLARAAGRLRTALPRERCAEFLRQVCTRSVVHRHVPDREIMAAVVLAYDTAPSTARSLAPRSGCRGVEGAGFATRRRVPTWPKMDEHAVQKVLALQGGALFDPAVDTGLSAEDALTALFSAGELVCGGAACERPVARRLEDWAGADAAQFVCPNPLKGMTGLTKDGRVSVRCQSNIAVRRWVIVECDSPALGKPMQAKIASVLARGLPLRLVVDSGGKSLHGWFACEGVEEGEVAKFFWLACALGADPSRWDPCGWVRMPGGLRRKPDGSTVRQRVVYAAKIGGV